jgi:hypothetical protein
MARPRIHPVGNKPQPFSLILEPAELAALRKIAGKERTSMGAIVRRAIHSVLFRANPALVDRIVEAELDGFLKRMGEKFPGAGMKGAKRGEFKKQIVKAIR